MTHFEGKTNRLINQKGFSICVDNTQEHSHNIHIDVPEYFTFALTICEALNKMKDSDFPHKEKKIFDITYF